jgi:hypothetical protein
MFIQDQINWNDLDSDWLSFFAALGVDSIHLETRQAVSVQDHQMNISDGKKQDRIVRAGP